MKTICDGCCHDWETPDDFIARLYPPEGATRMMSACGCDKCTEGFEGGPYYWRMEDGTYKPAMAGQDELEAQGIVTLDTLRLRKHLGK